LWGHARCSSEVREPHALLFDVLKHLRVGGTQIVETKTCKSLEHGRDERLIRQPEGDAGVAAPVTDCGHA
jgi:hypothetical protein